MQGYFVFRYFMPIAFMIGWVIYVRICNSLSNSAFHSSAVGRMSVYLDAKRCLLSSRILYFTSVGFHMILATDKRETFAHFLCLQIYYVKCQNPIH
jgi:hypothetical protein